MSSRQDQIKMAQQVLKDKGSYNGAVDGSMNGQFEKALRDYQNQNRLEATGKLDRPTMSKLGIMKGTPDSSNPGREKPKDVTPDNHITPGKDLNKTPEQQLHPEHKPDLNQSRTPNFDPATVGPSAQQSEDMVSGKVEHEYQQRATKAAEVLHSLTGSSDNRIPDTLLRRAEAIAVIPDMVKGAFGIGGTYGKGLVAERTKGGRWSAPAFISIGGGSFGLQLGVNSTDLVLVFTDKAALDSLGSGMSLKLGVNAGVTAGPIGREGEAAGVAKRPGRHLRLFAFERTLRRHRPQGGCSGFRKECESQGIRRECRCQHDSVEFQNGVQHQRSPVCGSAGSVYADEAKHPVTGRPTTFV